MLYFSKIKLLTIYIIIIFLTICSSLNFIDNKDNFFLSKKINLGLDLQGGSYLLLEVDSNPVIKRNLQQKLIEIRKYFKENKIKYENLNIKNTSINFNLTGNDIIEFEEFFLNKENEINFLYNQYRSY